MDEQLIIENQKLIYYVLKEMGLYHRSDDYFDLGMIGLVKGVKTYNDELDVKLSTYLARCIKNEILMEFRKEKALKRKSNDEALELSYKCDDIELIDVIDCGVDIESECFLKMDLERLEAAIRNLNYNERFIIYHNFGLYGFEQMKQYEIAKELGISRALVTKIKRNAINKLRKEMCK